MDFANATIAERFLMMLNDRVGEIETRMHDMSCKLDKLLEYVTTKYVECVINLTFEVNVTREEKIEAFASIAKSIPNLQYLSAFKYEGSNLYHVFFEVKTGVIPEYVADRIESKYKVFRYNKSSYRSLESFKRSEWNDYIAFDENCKLVENHY